VYSAQLPLIVRPSPISAATFAPTGNSPPGHDFTRPTHSMPAHMYLGVIDAERLYLDDDMYGSGSGISLMTRLSGPPNFSRTIARIGSLLGRLYNFD
jgi:hypothetical protein